MVGIGDCRTLIGAEPAPRRCRKPNNAKNRMVTEVVSKPTVCSQKANRKRRHRDLDELDPLRHQRLVRTVGHLAAESGEEEVGLKAGADLLICSDRRHQSRRACHVAPRFSLRLLLLSAFGGEMADRYDKALVAQRIKLVENRGVGACGVWLLAAHGWLRHHSSHHSVLGIVWFRHLRGAVRPDSSTASCPITSIAPSSGRQCARRRRDLHCHPARTIVGGLAAHGGGDPASFGFLMLIFSLACWGASLFIPPTGEAAPDLVIRRNVAASTRRSSATCATTSGSGGAPS